jgi:hypothetical protein
VDHELHFDIKCAQKNAKLVEKLIEKACCFSTLVQRRAAVVTAYLRINSKETV